MSEYVEIQETNTNVLPLHGRSIVKGVLMLKAQQIKDANIGKDTFFKGFYLEGTSDPALSGKLGWEVMIDKALSQDLPKFKYDKIYNPREIKVIEELLKSAPGRAVNDLIVNHTKIEVWVYFMIWNNDIVGVINPEFLKPDIGLLVPELDLTTPDTGEKSILEVEASITNKKLGSDDVKRIILPGEPQS